MDENIEVNQFNKSEPLGVLFQSVPTWITQRVFCDII